MQQKLFMDERFFHELFALCDKNDIYSLKDAMAQFSFCSTLLEDARRDSDLASLLRICNATCRCNICEAHLFDRLTKHEALQLFKEADQMDLQLADLLKKEVYYV